jgi:G3E family GTPase
VACADLVLINKIDRHEAAAIEWCRAQIAELNPAAEVRCVERCAVSCEWLVGAAEGAGLAGEYARCADPNFLNLVVRSFGLIDLPRLQAACQEFGEGLYRVKGPVRGPAGLIDVDFSSSGWHERPGRDLDRQLVLIGAGSAATRLRTLADLIQQGHFNCNPIPA